MNTNQSTVREALRRLVVAVQRSSDYSIMLLADAYALAAHIEACTARIPRAKEAIAADMRSEPNWFWPKETYTCGDNGYCDVAKKYLSHQGERS